MMGLDGPALVEIQAPGQRPELVRIGGRRVPDGSTVRVEPLIAHVMEVPRVRKWTLRVHGAVRREGEWDRAAFALLPRTRMRADTHCEVGWSVLDEEWSGVGLRDLADACGVRPDALHVKVHAYGGYSASFPIEDALDRTVLIADSLGGKPLARERGGPARLVVPQRFAAMAVKWVRGIEFLDEPQPGFWEQMGARRMLSPWASDGVAS